MLVMQKTLFRDIKELLTVAWRTLMKCRLVLIDCLSEMNINIEQLATELLKFERPNQSLPDVAGKISLLHGVMQTRHFHAGKEVAHVEGVSVY